MFRHAFDSGLVLALTISDAVGRVSGCLAVPQRLVEPIPRGFVSICLSLCFDLCCVPIGYYCSSLRWISVRLCKTVSYSSLNRFSSLNKSRSRVTRTIIGSDEIVIGVQISKTSLSRGSLGVEAFLASVPRGRSNLRRSGSVSLSLSLSHFS